MAECWAGYRAYGYPSPRVRVGRSGVPGLHAAVPGVQPLQHLTIRSPLALGHRLCLLTIDDDGLPDHPQPL